jgi:dienelactone hydrolase
MKLLILALIILSFKVYAFPVNNVEELLNPYNISTFKLGKIIKDKKAYLVKEGLITLNEYPSYEDLTFYFLFYKPKSNDLKPLIVLTPNINGVTILERRLAHHLCKNGYPVLVPLDRYEKFTFDKETVLKIERKERRALASTLLTIRSLKRKLPYLNTQKMGLVGASLGGIRSSMLYGFDDRFQAIFIAVAGGDLPSLYRETKLEQLVDFRCSHMRALGFTDTQEYEQHLRDYLFLDPNQVVKNPRLGNVAMVIADRDTTVPAINQWILWKKIKAKGIHPKTFILDKSHVRGAVELIVKKKFMLNWFARKLTSKKQTYLLP